MALEREKNKLVLERCQNILKELLKDEDNKYCVDCDAKSPRWASWNLGIFLCIRCAGIHRNLGVHISKVKSVNLDAWTPQQVACIQQMGNSRARAVYEANLQDNFRRPQTDSSLEQFIRAKYEAKKYIAKEWVPPPMPNPTWDTEIEKQLKKKKEKKMSGGSIEFPAPVKNSTTKTGISPKPLPKAPGGRNSSPNQKRISGSALNSEQKECSVSKENINSGSIDLLGLDAQTTTNGTIENDGDIFGDFLTAPSVPGALSGTSFEGNKGEKDVSQIDESNFFNQKQPELSAEKLSKDSILALYTQAPPNPQPHNPQAVFGSGNILMGQPGMPVITPTGIAAMVPQQAPQSMINFQQKNVGVSGVQPPFYPQGVGNIGGQLYPGIPTAAPQTMTVGMPLSAANPFAQIQAQMSNLNLSTKVSGQAQQTTGVPNQLLMGSVMGSGPPISSNQTQATTLSSNLWQ